MFANLLFSTLCTAASRLSRCFMNASLVSLLGSKERTKMNLLPFFVLAASAMVLTAMCQTRLKSSLEGIARWRSRQHNRNLRFFDPDHALCGEGVPNHEFAVSCLYGAKATQYPDYYRRKTVSTKGDLPYDRVEVEKILRALSFVARETDRAIRVSLPIFFYDDLHEAVQPYSVVNANRLREVGVFVVEPLYWARADGLRNLEKKGSHAVHEIELGGTISVLQSAVTDMNENRLTADEIQFSVDGLLALDTEAVGSLVGARGGYVGGSWSEPFACAIATNELRST